MFRRIALTFPLRELVVLSLLTFLTVVMLWPLSTNLSSMVPEATDPLLNAWRMQWDARAFLSGPAAVASLFNTNILYPFPLTLAYSEHFLMPAALALPLLVTADSHLVGMNLSVLLTFILSGYAMYLLMSAWTGSRLAGFTAGLLFSFAPLRFGQLYHLELLVTQWMPLTLLALHWLLIRPGRRYGLLFTIFFNLQALSGFHYGLTLAVACAVLVLVYLLAGRVHRRWGLLTTALLAGLATFLLNWPVWRVYLRFSDIMGAVRTPGEVRVYSAAATDYVTTIPYNWLYGWTFGRWQAPDHQIQPLMPFAVTGLVLALLGLGWGLSRIGRRREPSGERVTRLLAPGLNHNAIPTLIFTLILALLGLLLSFGLNETALGPGLTGLLEYSPYAWLYDNVIFFRGIRVPGRFAVMVLVALVIMAGWGVAALAFIFGSPQRAGQAARSIPGAAYSIAGLILAGSILLEAWSAPLIGPEFPGGSDIPMVYHWLREETPAETVVLELPHHNYSEFLYEYFSSYHWRPIANGSTGFTPPIYRDLRRWFSAFPDPRSVDVIQQLGIDLVILHPESYRPADWQRLQADLPLYLPAFSAVHQIGDALILTVAEPVCRPQPESIQVSLAPAGPGHPGSAIVVAYQNNGPAAFVSDVQQVSRLSLTDQPDEHFIEPLVVPAGHVQSVTVPIDSGQRAEPAEQLLAAGRISGAALASLDRTFSGQVEQPGPPPSDAATAWQPLGLQFEGGAHLVAYSLNPDEPVTCGHLELALKWQNGQAGDTVLVQLLDPYGRLVIENESKPWQENSTEQIDIRSLPLSGALPPGRYGLRVRVRTADGQERLPVTEAGVTIPVDQIPPLPVTIHPAPQSLPETLESIDAVFDDGIKLLGRIAGQEQASAGDWLRFTLVWEAETRLEQDWTVFTQLIGPDGRVWGQQDHQPKGGWYSTSLWQPGQAIRDDYAFQIANEAPPGLYRLVAGLYDSQSLARLPVTTAGGQRDFVEVGMVRLEE